MKTIKVNSQLKLVVTSLAIAFSTTFLQSANAQSLRGEIPEIGWRSRLSSMGLDQAKNIGKTYNFYCQPASKDMLHAPIWGTNIYTINSGICTTAVHSGMISESGGIVSIELLEGQEFYTGSSKNEIISEDHIGTSLSFTFIGEAIAVDNLGYQPNNQQRRPSTIERVMVNSVQRGLERSIERAITDIFKID